MSLRRIGPIAIDHRDPSLTWTSGADIHGVRTASINGVALVASVTQLDELVANGDRRITYGRHTGVLEFVDFDDEELVGPCRGWYLLTGFRKSVEYRWSVTPYTSFSLDAAFLAGVQPIVTRSARERINDHGLVPVAVVADPLWAQDDDEPFTPAPSGGTLVTREFDPTPHGTLVTPDTGGRDLTLYRGTFVGGSDVLPPVAVPAPRSPDADSTLCGSDVRAWDRRLGQEVYGQGHGFRRETDIVVTNGLLRFRVGNRGVIPSVHVEAFASGSWRDEGFLSFSQSSADIMRAARLVYLTAEQATVVLTARLSGDISLTLRRGARGIEVTHGSDLPPFSTSARAVSWRGLPPVVTMSGLSSSTGKFGNGLAVSGVVQFYWPEDQGTRRWAFSTWWKPTAASASQADSGIFALIGSDGSVVGEVGFAAATKKISFTLGAATIESAALTFSAGDDIFVGVDFDDEDGMKLVTKVAAGTTTVVVGSSTDPGDAAGYHSCAMGAVYTTYGSEPYGSGPYGGTQLTEPLGGVVDNVMVFDGPLTTSEWATLAAGTHRLDGLPVPESRLIWHTPMDTNPVPVGSSLLTGRRFAATIENGSTPQTEHGLTKALASLETVGPATPFAIGASGQRLTAYAYLYTSATGDGLADHHAQHAAANEQELRVRQ